MYAEHLPSFGIHGLQIQKWITTTWQKGKLQMNLIVFFFFFPMGLGSSSATFLQMAYLSGISSTGMAGRMGFNWKIFAMVEAYFQIEKGKKKHLFSGSSTVLMISCCIIIL